MVSKGQWPNVRLLIYEIIGHKTDLNTNDKINEVCLWYLLPFCMLYYPSSQALLADR